MPPKGIASTSTVNVVRGQALCEEKTKQLTLIAFSFSDLCKWKSLNFKPSVQFLL